MPPGEVTVTCEGCGRKTSLPFAAVKRGNSYCGACGKQLPLNNVTMAPTDPAAGQSQAKRRPYRSTKRR